jgi:LacI family transcriptional regulator
VSNLRNKAPGNREATIKDVAREAGVSAMTVSRVINSKTNVKPVTRDKIQKAITKVNYRPNVGARLLSGRQTYQFLMLYNNPNVGWMGELLIGMMNSCRRIGYHLSIEGVGEFEDQTPETIHDPREINRLIDRSRIDGIILPPPICFDQVVLDAIKEQGIPCVRLASTPQRDIKLCVSIDNYAAGYEITRHLIELGHEDISIIKGPVLFAASAMRFEGYAAAMRDHGLAIHESNIETGNFDVQSGYRCARTLLSRKHCPTAIFASNDEMAAGTLAAAQEMKISVPEQLSVAGFDDAPIAHSVWPKLTTVRQPLRAMGEQAVNLLERYVRHMDDESLEEVQPAIVLEYKLIERQSTGPALKTKLKQE